MAMFDLRPFSYDSHTGVITRILNKKYGEGRAYKEYSQHLFDEVFVHETDECIRRFTYSEAMRDFNLLEEIYKNTGMRDYHNSPPVRWIAQDEVDLPHQEYVDKVDKKCNNIREDLQIEVDDWLKDIGV